MIGRLLQSAASTFSQHSSSRPQTPLESVTEDAHTRDLLYPDGNSLRISHYSVSLAQNTRFPSNAREATNYDDRGGLDVAYPADIRIIIAQDVNSRYQQPQVLYDSRPPPNIPTSRNGSPQQDREASSSLFRMPSRGKGNRSPATIPSRRFHSPQSSIFQSSQIQPLSPISPRSPEYRFRSPLGDTRSRAATLEQSANDLETAQGKVAREGKEDTEALLGCMFGAPGFRIEPGTKLHIVPRKSPDALNSGNRSPNVARPLSSGGFTRKRTPLVRSTSVADLSKEEINYTDNRTSQYSRPSIMFTRLFSVHLPESVSPNAEEVAQEPDQMDQNHGSDPTAKDDDLFDNGSGRKVVKQKKVPMYAIAVIIQLPTDGSQPRLRSQGSHHGVSSLGSSYNDSTPATSWHAEHGVFARFMEARSTASLSGVDTVLNLHISHILTHWNVVSRALELLEAVASRTLRTVLEHSTPLAPLMAAPPARSGSTKFKKPKQPTQQSIHVMPGCLQESAIIQKETAITSQRIVGGLRTRRVVTGQARWGAWREEARWIGRWAGDREQTTFFFAFLTTFLGNHTSWLGSIAPAQNRRRRAQLKDLGKDENHIKQRTVIVSCDKMAARRLIFLLSTFIPGCVSLPTSQLPLSSHPSMKYSESPSSLPPIRDQSLSRATEVNTTRPRRNGTNASDHARTVSFSLIGAGGGESENNDFAPEALARRTSDARSIRSASLAIPVRAGDTRKSSTSTIIADTALPTPHFSNLSTQAPPGTAGVQRPGSSGSLASIALTHTLKRSESSALSTSGSGGGRWGSMVSGFWSNRRGSSTDESDAFLSSQEALADTRAPKDKERSPTTTRLSHMVEQAAALTVDGNGNSSTSGLTSHPALEDCLKPTDQDGGSAARSIPRRTRMERMPLKLSVNEDDGYIDVDLPRTHSFSSSLTSSYNSSRAQNVIAGSPNGHFSPYGLSSTSDSPRNKSEPTIDVAGWLKRYHPDFSLQAVRPYEALKQEIKLSMRAEARLIHPSTSKEFPATNGKWTDISTTVIADTATFSIYRLRLQRRLRKELAENTVPITHDSDFQHNDEVFELKFAEDQILDSDPILTTALERILSQSGHSSRVPSRAPSPNRVDKDIRMPPSPTRGLASGPLGAAPLSLSRPASIRRAPTDGPVPALEVPHEECRRVVLGALEEIVRSVVTEGVREGKGRDGRRAEGGALREGVRLWLSEGVVTA